MGALVRAIAWSARRTRGLSEKCRKTFRCGINQRLLRLPGQKVFLAGTFRIPVFKPNPGHAPVNVWDSGFPQGPQQNAALSWIVQVTFHGRPAKVRGAVERGREHTAGNPVPVGLEQTRALPALGQPIAQPPKIDLMKLFVFHFCEVNVCYDEVHTQASVTSSRITVALQE